MPTTPTLANVVAAFDHLYDPRTAESWDAVGLVCGDPAAEVRKVLLAVDPVELVVSEAVEWGAGLVVTHHPLFLRPVHGVAATTPKGRLVHDLVSRGIGLHCVHTNADVADPGVSDALADALGLVDLRPLAPRPADALDKLVTFVPADAAERVLDAVAVAGAGHIGDYERCAWTTDGVGTFRPLSGSSPTIGSVGETVRVDEVRLEMVLPRRSRQAVTTALLEAHPYEQPAYDVVEIAATPGTTGIGRVGRLPAPEPLARFVERVAVALPATTVGVRATGDPDRLITSVAVCGGAGDSLLATVAEAGVDAYVTADLRHHPASESDEAAGPALVDATHWATEWPWLKVAARRLQEVLAADGSTVDVRVSTTPTDPWTTHVHQGSLS